MSRRLEAAPPTPTLETTAQRRALAIATEPGDEVFGCGGTLARHIAIGDPVRVLVVSDGFRDTTDADALAKAIQEHEHECRAAAEALGYGEPLCWNEPLTSIAYGERLIQRITATIIETGATIVYAPSPMDPNSARSAMGLNAREAVRRASTHCALACYELDVPLQVNQTEDIEGTLTLKRSAMACFKSRDDRDRVARTMSLNRLRAYSLEQPSTAAEGFSAIAANALIQPVSGTASRQSPIHDNLTDQPLVSVIVRSQNRPELTDALDSIALQTYRQIEVVLIDVSGTNSFDTGEWCGQFPLRVASTGHHLGRGEAANVGLDHATGQYLLFLDDDDWLLSNHVALLVAALRRSEHSSVAYSGIECRRMSDQGAWEFVRVFNDFFDRRRLLVENFIPIHAVLFDRSLIEKQARFDESLEVYEDWDFWVQLSRLSDFVHVDEITAIYRISRESGFGVRADPRTTVGVQAFFQKWLHQWAPQDLLDVIAYHQQKSELEQTAARQQTDELNDTLVQRDVLIAEMQSTAAQQADAWVAALAERDHRIAEMLTEAAQQADAWVAALAERDNRIAEMLTEAARQADTWAATLAERDNRIAEILTEAARQADTWAATLAERDNRIAEMLTDATQQADDWVATLAERDDRLTKAASEIERLTLSLQDSRASLDQITAEQARSSAHSQELENALSREQALTAALKTEMVQNKEAFDATLAQRDMRISALSTELAEAALAIESLKSTMTENQTVIEELSTRQTGILAHAKEVEDALAQEQARVAELRANRDDQTTRLQAQERTLQALQEQLRTIEHERQRMITKLTNLYVSAAWSISARICATERRFPRSMRTVLKTTKALFWTLSFKLPSALRRRKQARRIVESGLFDQHWYTQTYPDVLMNGYRPVIHWMLHGWREGLNPSPLFDMKWYLKDGSEPAPDGHDPDPITLYLDRGMASGRSPHPLFDAEWYLRTYLDVRAAGVDPFQHFITTGFVEGRNPNPYFDTDWYRKNNPDSLNANPLYHYVTVGAREGRNPSPRFDTNLYWSRHPDSHHLNPLVHYIISGAAQVQPTWTEEPLSEPVDSPDDPTRTTIPDWHGEWTTLFPTPNPTPQRILVIDWKPPTPDRDSGSYRMRMLLELLVSAGHQVDFVGDRPAEDPGYSQALKDLGIGVVIGADDALAQLQVNGGEYRAIWISRPELAEQYLPMVRAFAVRARVIYDTVDLHWVRFERGIEFADDPNAIRELAERYKRLELSNARAADLTIAITAEEKRALLAQDPELPIAVIPNLHRICEDVKPVAKRTNLFFIGGFNHAPNVDAVTWCAREIMPFVQEKLPGVRLNIVGSDMPNSVSTLSSALINPIGYVEDVTPWFEQSRVFIAPLRHGAGMKGKVGQSLSFGLPVVTTSIGAEGIGLTHEVDALIADDPEEFVEAIVRLCTDDELWTRISNNGYELIKQRYSTEAVARQLLPLLG